MHVSRSMTLVVVASLLVFGPLAVAPPAQAANVTFVIEAKGIAFSPSYLRVEPGDIVTIIVFNNETSAILHTFDIDEYGIHLGTPAIPIPAGGSGNATFTADRAGTFYYHCKITFHATSQGGGRWTGMAGRLQVGEPPSDPMPVIVGGLAVLFVSLAAIAYAARRGAKKPKSP